MYIHLELYVIKYCNKSYKKCIAELSTYLHIIHTSIISVTCFKALQDEIKI